MTIWLTIADRIPVGEWRRKIGHFGICNLCNTGDLQTTRHAFFECEAMVPIWTKIREIMSLVPGAPKIDTWEQALYGNLGHPRFNSTNKDICGRVERIARYLKGPYGILCAWLRSRSCGASMFNMI